MKILHSAGDETCRVCGRPYLGGIDVQPPFDSVHDWADWEYLRKVLKNNPGRFVACGTLEATVMEVMGS